MAELHKLEYFVLRYVPDVVKGEFVNIGVVAFEGGVGGNGFADLRLIDDFSGVPLSDPEFEIEYLTEIEVGLRARLLSVVEDCSKGGVALRQREWMLRTVLDSFSNRLQISEVRALAAVDPADALNELMKAYCGPAGPRPAATVRTRKLTGRPYIRARMTDAFTNAGLMPYMRPQLAVADYTGDGDRLKIDYCCEIQVSNDAMVVGGGAPRAWKLFHAVSLKAESAKVKELAFTWPRLRDGLEKKEKVVGLFTAIVEDDVDRNRKEIEFALRTIQESEMVVRQVSQLAEIAAETRRELKM